MKKKLSPPEPKAKGVPRQRDASSGSSFVEGWKDFVVQLPLEVYPPETELAGQGAPAKKVFFIEAGLVKLTHMESEGQEAIIGLRYSGWLLGAALVVLQKPYPVTATTLTLCHLRPIPAEEFLDRLKTNAPVSWYLHQMRSREVYDWVAHVSGLASLPARRRLEHVLRAFVQVLNPIILRAAQRASGGKSYDETRPTNDEPHGYQFAAHTLASHSQAAPDPRSHL